nr:aldehyde dehydrogenase family protein [Bacillus subtilis]
MTLTLKLRYRSCHNGGLPFNRYQKCTATSRVIVQSGIYERFKEKLLQRTKDITIGDSLKEDVWMGY